MKKLLIIVSIILSFLIISQVSATTTKKYCGDGQEKLNSQGNLYCYGAMGTTEEKKSEYSSEVTCDGYYKTFIYKTNNKLTGIFIKNNMCKDAARDFNHNPPGGIEEECKRWGGTGKYKWVYSGYNDYAWATLGVVCEVEVDSNSSDNSTINLDECPTIEAKVCGKKGSYYSSTRKTYKNMCFLIKDGATYISPGECQLRDSKGCLVDKYKWCSTLKRCLKTSKYCPSSDYTPDLDSATKGVLDPLVTDFINKLNTKFSDNEKRLQMIDKAGEAVDKMLYRYSKYKSLLYYILQKIEAKRTDYLNFG